LESALKQRHRGAVPSIYEELSQNTQVKKRLTTVGLCKIAISEVLSSGTFTETKFANVADYIVNVSKSESENFADVILCCDTVKPGDIKLLTDYIRSSELFYHIPVVLLTDNFTKETKKEIFQLGLDDVFDAATKEDLFYERIELISQAKKKKLKYPEENSNQSDANIDINFSFPKRAGDILVSFVLLVILAPFLLVIAILIKLESKGPILYTSKRAGAGYKIFDFYKFRSMAEGAEKEMSKVLHLNQYDIGKENSNSVFYKIKGDPRVTRIGAFMRRTSIDELPQLINVIKGDMSLVGNRPLPLYEAQQLTRDNWVSRFNAPAGITGLWQVSKRGKSEMSEQERVELDVEYSKKHSFWYDLRILIRTVPVIFQEDRV
jgi:lipopolysaccharide/colanic/teichoic acid biosynthesis glycosyltransferase